MPKRLPTMAEPMTESLEKLLSSGWVVTSGSPAIGMILRNDRRWAMCELVVNEPRVDDRTGASRCYRLN